MSDPRQLFRFVFHFQRWALRFLALVFVLALLLLLRRFYRANTDLVPERGGTYIEGSVSQFQPLNPWFTVTNNVNRDIVSLVFSGLLKYNPETKRIEDDLATLAISRDGRVYTLTLKDNILWHDSTPDAPHPVTIEDVLFTFQTIQNPDFPNSLLRENFRGVNVEKIDARTVHFVLDEPYSFFASNLTLGLLPKRSFEGVPVRKIDQALDFGLKPVGAGPYAFKSLVQTDLSTEVTLERFPRPIDPDYFIKRIVFRIFPDYSTLLADIRNLDGVRLVPRNNKSEPIVPRRFVAINYTLPQYVALFFNLGHSVLQDPKLRLGLQLGTDKQAIVNALGESVIVDTPLLELDTANWRYNFDATAAQGALFESKWNLPEKVRLQRLLEIRETNQTGLLHADPIVLLDTGAALTLTGSLATAPLGTTVNGIPIQQNPSASGSWILALPTVGGTGSLKIGQNLVQLLDPKGKVIDTTYVWRTTSTKEYRRASAEQLLVRQFIDSRSGSLPPDQRITVQDLAVEQGMLRRRLENDKTDIRVNDRNERLTLRLLTSASPSTYRKTAELIRDQWAQLGVEIILDIPETRAAFEKKLIGRDYDILLFGQSLLDNLDSYPYWHSDGIQHLEEAPTGLRLDAYNFSQYSSFKADTLLTQIRQTFSEEERQEALGELRKVLAEDVPAVFLYSPLYTFAYHQDVHNVSIGHPSLHSDRFLTLHKWYILQERQFRPGKSWWSFIPWLLSGS
ncbi:MAG: ABC transporter substrate-binding protein [Candidatus Peribacteraceae bacterium]|nr:ABC transporter substrate-binding protein [Candidatus Peribacteraceae bacterium]MDD5742841.1 ABC transporter substrate-binding protein [Candidatus Peribacteraceae bacterium]